MADDFPKPVNTSKQDPELLSGPHPFLHWLVPKRVLCGPFPDSTLVDILLEKVRITHIVDLTTSRDNKTPYYSYGVKKQVKRICCPIPNWEIIEDKKVKNLCLELKDILFSDPNSCIYIHCRGGIGRTGVISGCLLAYLYQLDGQECLDRVAFHYSHRQVAFGRSPETTEQRMQVKRIASNLVSELKGD